MLVSSLTISSSSITGWQWPIWMRRRAIWPEAAMESIPGQVYSLCVRANWIEHPDPGWGEWNEEDGAPVELGEFLVPTRFKEAWMLTLKDTIDDMVAFSIRQADHGRPNRNPREWIEHFKSLDSKGRWTDEEIGFEAKLDTQTIVRYKQGVRGHPANLKKLAQFFGKTYPTEFKNFHWTDLRWSKTPV